jgi:Zn-dependent protease
MEIKGITLFIFGGAAEMAEEPPNPRAEALMALAGPAVSLVLGIVFYAVSSALESAGGPDPIVGVTAYLGGINLILAVFNLIPAYPLDGGRVLRAALWAWRRNLRWATDVAAQVGGAFGLVLVGLGIFEVVIGRVGDGMWLFLIGLFLRAAATASYQRMVARDTLTGIPVASLMTRAPVAGAPDATLADLVDSHFLGRSLKLVPIVDNSGRLVGSIDARQVKAIPREDWATRRAADVMTPISRENTIDPLADAATALERMQGAGRSRLMVADGDRLEGILTLRDMLQALNLRRDLGEPPPRGAWREPPSRPAGAHGD